VSGSEKGMMDLFAQYERAVIRARTKTALAHKKAQGERTGGVCYGMQLSSDGIHVEPNVEEQAVIALARALHQEGLSSRKIAAKLAEQGMVSRMGTVFTPSAIINMVHA
jgi:DNA invertase Pin-like site-specific DNA recombinase